MVGVTEEEAVCQLMEFVQLQRFPHVKPNVTAEPIALDTQAPKTEPEQHAKCMDLTGQLIFQVDGNLTLDVTLKLSPVVEVKVGFAISAFSVVTVVRKLLQSHGSE